MKILFFVSEDKNLGVGYLSSYLKQGGHKVSLLFDPMQFSKSYIRSERLARHFSKKEYFLYKIKEIRPELIGFSVVTANYQWALSMAAEIKRYFDIPTIFGGVHPTLVPERVIRQPAVDMVCVGEGEEALLELADNFGTTTDIRNIYFKRGQEIIPNPLRPLTQDLDRYPFPDEGLFYAVLPPSYRLSSSVMTSRGCPFCCTYCSNHSLAALYQGQRYVRRRSVDNVINELSQRKRGFGTRHFVFMDDIFASDAAWLKEFVPRYRREVGLPFNCLAHPGICSDTIIGLLKEAGCTAIDFGLQSGSERLRRDALLRNETNDSVIRVASACKRHRIHFAIDQILNVPGETETDIRASLELLTRIKPDIVNCYSLLYFPKAAIVKKAQEAGLLSERDVDRIEEGLNANLYSTASVGSCRRGNATSYRRYALLFCCIPILPRWLLRKIIASDRLMRLFARVPLAVLPFVKVIVDLLGGLGFIPFAVAGNEFFYLRQHAQYQRYVGDR